MKKRIRVKLPEAPTITVQVRLFKTGTRGLRFTSTVVGHKLDIPPSLTPFLTAARAIKAANLAPDHAPIVMVHDGQTEPALCSTVAVAASLIVSEGRNYGPVFAKWAPHYRNLEEEEGSDDDNE